MREGAAEGEERGRKEGEEREKKGKREKREREAEWTKASTPAVQFLRLLERKNTITPAAARRMLGKPRGLFLRAIIIIIRGALRPAERVRQLESSASASFCDRDANCRGIRCLEQPLS